MLRTRLPSGGAALPCGDRQRREMAPCASLLLSARSRSSPPSARRSISSAASSMSLQSADNPAIVDWALASIRGPRSSRTGPRPPPANLDDPETVKAGARAYSTIGCVNCHGGPPDANWAKWSEGLKPVPADLKVMAKERTAPQLFWAIKNGIKFTGMPSFGLAGASDQDIWSDRRLYQEAADRDRTTNTRPGRRRPERPLSLQRGQPLDQRPIEPVWLLDLRRVAGVGKLDQGRAGDRRLRPLRQFRIAPELFAELGGARNPCRSRSYPCRRS